MTKIDKHIEELLYNHDCVIVPDFGGFITSKKPAYFNPLTSVFFPATKTILFNKHLVYNDGLLAAKVAEKRALSMEESQQLLMQFKDDCFLRLNEEGRVEIEKVGVLFFDKEKNIQFQQASTNFLKDSFGLTASSVQKIEVKEVVKPKVVVPAAIIERPVEVKVDRVTEKRTEKPARVKNPNRVGRLIPLLMIPLIAGGIFMITQQADFDKQNFNVANFNPFQGTYTQEYKPRTGDNFFIEKEQIELNIPVVTLEKEVNTELNSTTESIEEIPTKIDSTYNETVEYSEDKNYHVIAGCFSIKENAEGLVNQWIESGTGASIIDKKGRLYRVAIESFSTRKEAKNFLRKTKKESNISLWILKK